MVVAQSEHGRAAWAGEGGSGGPLLRCPRPHREKLVKAVVELLSSEETEPCPAALVLRLVALLMERCDCCVPFATEGGVRAMLACMRQHATSALVQQAGLAVSACGSSGVGGARFGARRPLSRCGPRRP